MILAGALLTGLSAKGEGGSAGPLPLEAIREPMPPGLAGVPTILCPAESTTLLPSTLAAPAMAKPSCEPPDTSMVMASLRGTATM